MTARQFHEQSTRQKYIQEELLSLKKLAGRNDPIDERLRKEAVDKYALMLGDIGLSSVVEMVEKEFGKKYSESHFLELILQGIQASRMRLDKEINAQQRRGSVNLVIGMIVTAIGLTYLIYTVHVTTSSESVKDIYTFLMGFIPRISLAFFMQIFAFFFLRLYKLSLVEIKFFQNELTNVESKWVAMSAAIHSAGAGPVNDMANELIKTERNFVLEKNQKTILGENQKDAMDSIMQLIRAFAGSIDVVAKEKPVK